MFTQQLLEVVKIVYQVEKDLLVVVVIMFSPVVVV
jgi:hypothetical protein